MVMSADEAAEAANYMYHSVRSKERKRLEEIQSYLNNDRKLAWLPFGATPELQAISRMSRVNVADLVLKATTQQMFVDGYYSEDSATDDSVMRTWSLNKMDRKQIGIHRSGSAYGVTYVVLTPGDPVPVQRPVSPLKMTTAYDWTDEEWPQLALEDMGRGVWRLYDSTHIYVLSWTEDKRRISGDVPLNFELVDTFEHNVGVCPVVRYVADVDIDSPVRGDIEPILPVIDQLQMVTFQLNLSQMYDAAGRKLIVGRMLDDLERELMAAGANTTTLIDADPDSVRVVEMSQTDLGGFIESRRATLELLSALSQTPTQELLGSIANLSAAALDETRESTDRKVNEREVTFGESHKQLLAQTGSIQGHDVDPFAEVRWKVTRPQRQVAMVDLLIKMSNDLGVPQEALFQYLPFSYSEIEEMRNAGMQPTPSESQDIVDETAGQVDEVVDSDDVSA